MADSRFFVDVFGEIVDAMRATGSIIASSEVSGIYTLTSANTFNAFESVKIDSIDYLIVSATTTEFVIETTTGLNFTGETWQALAPYYIYGHPLEIANRLLGKDKGKEKKWRKYPLIALFQDFTEDHSDNFIIDYTLPFSIIIAYNTKKTYISEERYTNTFKPILYPLYEDLLTYMTKSPALYENRKDRIEHNKIDRLFWGANGVYGNEGLIFNDNLDAIEVNFDGAEVIKDVMRNCPEKVTTSGLELDEAPDLDYVPDLEEVP